jgi:hypothetical protein
MDPPAYPPIMPYGFARTFLAGLIFVTVAGIFCWLLGKCCSCICSIFSAFFHPAEPEPEPEPVAVAVPVPPRIQSIDIDQLMPVVVVEISSNGNEKASNNGGGSECAICLEEFEDRERSRVFPKCNHQFHVLCINAWLLRQNLTCPLCRNSLKDTVWDLHRKHVSVVVAVDLDDRV